LVLENFTVRSKRLENAVRALSNRIVAKSRRDACRRRYGMLFVKELR
jgi:hypothetical protein